MLEVNLPYCWQHAIPVFRRISGGGVVFHDEGNLNLSFITQYTLKNFNQYRSFLEPVLNYLKSIGISLTIDQRNNLRLGSKKVSGNAQFISRNRMLSHGTLLINSDLKRLKQTLKKSKPLMMQVESRATSSVRSSVTNIAVQIETPLEVEQIAKDLKEVFGGQNFAAYQFTEAEWQKIVQLANTKYRSFQWTVAESPPLKIEKRIKLASDVIHLRYELQEGIFKKVEIFDGEFEFLKEMFEGQKLSEELWRKIETILADLSVERRLKMEQFINYFF